MTGLNLNVPGLPTTTLGGDSLINVKPTTKVTFGDEKCKACTDYIDSKMPFLRNGLTSLNLSAGIPDNAVLPVVFHNCKFISVENVSRYGDACLTSVPNQPNKTDTKSNFMWSQFTVMCDFAFSTSVDELLNQVKQLLTSCTSGQTSVDLSWLTSGLNMKVLNTVDCIARVNVGVNIPSTLNVTLIVTSKNAKISADIRKDKNFKGPKSVTVLEFGFIEVNLADVNSTCRSQDKTMDNCKCLDDNGLTDLLASQMREVIAQCFAKSDSKQMKSVLDA